jgi:transposase
MESDEARIRELEDQLQAAERRADEARRERDEAHNLGSRMQEQVADANALIERWIEAFDMQLGDDGTYQFDSDYSIELLRQVTEQYSDLLKRWNDIVPKWNAIVAPTLREPGRPLAASETQVKAVVAMRRKGFSIRAIADETTLGVMTVRTIVGRENWTDRASKRRLEKIDYKPIRAELIAARSRKRTRDGLPRAIAETLKAGAELLKEARGIK